MPLKSTENVTPAGITLLCFGILLSMAVPVRGFADEPNLAQWTVYQIRLSSYELMVKVPGGQDREIAPVGPVPFVDLDRDVGAPGRDPYALVFRRSWAYRGFFWQGLLGALDMHVIAQSTTEQYAKDLRDFENLRELNQMVLATSYAGSNRANVEAGRPDLVVTLPSVDAYRRVQVNQREWLTYSLGGFASITDYLTPLTPTRYLRVRFDFIDNSRGKNRAWREKAEAVVAKIVSSLEIRRAD